MYLFARVGTRTGTPLYSTSLGQPGQCTYLPGLVLVLVPLVQCFAWSARVMYLFARVHTRAVRESLHSVYCACIPCTVLRMVSPGNVPICPCSYSYWYPLYSASLGQHGQCTYLPVFVLVLVPLMQCFAWTAREMYLFDRACILVQCFVMGNPSHVRILVFGPSRCTCSATPTDMDSLLVMSRDGFYVRCICAGCLYLACREAVVRLPVCTADREGGWQPRLIYTMYIIHHVYTYYFFFFL